MDLIDREWVLNNPDKPSTFVDAVMCAPTVESIPIEVLDKIRAEIEQLPLYCAKFKCDDFAYHIDKEQVLQIIDKYRGES